MDVNVEGKLQRKELEKRPRVAIKDIVQCLFAAIIAVSFIYNGINSHISLKDSAKNISGMQPTLLYCIITVRLCLVMRYLKSTRLSRFRVTPFFFKSPKTELFL